MTALLITSQSRREWVETDVGGYDGDAHNYDEESNGKKGCRNTKILGSDE